MSGCLALVQQFKTQHKSERLVEKVRPFRDPSFVYQFENIHLKALIALCRALADVKQLLQLEQASSAPSEEEVRLSAPVFRPSSPSNGTFLQRRRGRPAASGAEPAGCCYLQGAPNPSLRVWRPRRRLSPGDGRGGCWSAGSPTCLQTHK